MNAEVSDKNKHLKTKLVISMVNRNDFHYFKSNNRWKIQYFSFIVKNKRKLL